MRLYKVGNHRLYMVPESYEWRFTQDDASRFVNVYLKHIFLRRPLFRQIVSQFSTERPAVKILEAHGASVRKQWLIRDGELRNVQDWVSWHEHSASVLLLAVCNPENLPLTAKKAVLIHPTKSYSMLDGMRGQAGMRIFVPGLGYCDTHYQLRRALDVLKQKQV